MRASYSIYPQSGYIAENFRGVVTYGDLARFHDRQERDTRLCAHFHTVSDFTSATLHLSDEDVYRWWGWLCAAPARTGRRALVVTRPRNLAPIQLLRALSGQASVAVQYFSRREAAVRWVFDHPNRQSDRGQTSPTNLSTATSGSANDSDLTRCASQSPAAVCSDSP